MSEWLESFLPDFVEYIWTVLQNLLDVSEVGIIVGIIFAFIIIKAIIRMVQGF